MKKIRIISDTELVISRGLSTLEELADALVKGGYAEYLPDEPVAPQLPSKIEWHKDAIMGYPNLIRDLAERHNALIDYLAAKDKYYDPHPTTKE